MGIVGRFKDIMASNIHDLFNREDTHPEQTVKETAYQLGFSATASFCRYFKRATGIYPQEYKERVKGSGH